MISRVYCVHDSLSGFMHPILDQNDAMAMRNFSLMINETNTTMRFSPSDFSLYHIADFDTVSGEILPVVPPEVVCRGDSVGGESRA